MKLLPNIVFLAIYTYYNILSYMLLLCSIIYIFLLLSSFPIVGNISKETLFRFIPAIFDLEIFMILEISRDLIYEFLIYYFLFLLFVFNF